MQIQQINKNISQISEEVFNKQQEKLRELHIERLNNKIIPSQYDFKIQNDSDDFDSSDLLKLGRRQLDNNSEYEMEQRLQHNVQILKTENNQSENDFNSLNNNEDEFQENSLDHRQEMPIQNNMRILNQNNNLFADHAHKRRGQNMQKNDQSKKEQNSDMYLKNDTLTQQPIQDTDNNNFLSNLWEGLKQIGSLGLAALVKCWAWICQCCKNMPSSSAEINDNAIIDDNNSISGSKENNTCPGVSEDFKLSNAQYIKNSLRSNSSYAMFN